jgi:hypothetical protein
LQSLLHNLPLLVLLLLLLGCLLLSLLLPV